MKKNIFFSALIFACFLIDIFFLGFFESQIVATLLCFYTLLLTDQGNTRLLFLSLFLISFYPLILYGTFGLSLLYLLPLSIIVMEMKSLFRRAVWLPYFFLVAALLANQLIIKQYMLGLGFYSQFFLASICVNLVILLIFEKYFSQR